MGGTVAMERADTEIQEMTDDLFAWGEGVAVAVDCVGFDGESITAPEAAEAGFGLVEDHPAPAGTDLLVLAASQSLSAELRIPPLPPEMERRINAYYASGERFPAIAPSDRSVMEPPAARKRRGRLGHFITALVGA
ncbi:MAG TPA: hypothetical protein VNV38_20225 [Stellaceae bacterium]|jgi:hypothetical protein|nr:hypothetical protein [Stellaceae bacterium]